MQCEACGATIPNDVDSCPQCGASLTTSTEPGAGTDHGGPAAGANQRADDRQGTTPHQQSPDRAPQGGGQASGGGQPQQGHQAPPRQAGTGGDLVSQAGQVLGRLPWKAGLVAGGLLYGFLFVVFAAPAVYFEVARGLEIARAVFLGLVTFVSLSDVAMTVGRMAGESVPAEVASGQYDALAGVLTLFAPYLLYASGRKFAQWNDADPDDVVVGYLGAGAAVVFGTVPVVALVTFLFGGDLVNETLMAGLVIPGLLGAFGGAMAWAFRDRSRAASWGSGIVTGIVGMVLLLGLTSMWAQSGAGLAGGNSGMSRLVAAMVVFVSVTTFGFSASGAGLLAYVAVGWTTALLVVGIVVAVNAYVLDGFAQLSTVSGGSGITIDPNAVDPPRDRYRFYVVTQATMLACGWFAGTASRGRYEALLHSSALVLVAYVVFTGAGMV